MKHTHGAARERRVNAGIKVLDMLERLQNEMKDKKITKETLARRIGFDAVKINNILSYTSDCSFRNFVAVANEIGFNIVLRRNKNE